VWLVIEDLHWADPSTLEVLTLLLEQGPTAALCTVLTCRPTFTPPWGLRAHVTTIVLDRLTPAQVTTMVHQLAHGKTLPPDIIELMHAKTDGIPLFVEELTKAVLTSGALQATGETYTWSKPLQTFAIPATLHDILMVRLDRQASVKAVAQLAATLGRQFAYDLLRAVAPWDERTLEESLQQLVADELLYRQGVPSQATYLFKHALICDAA
jgi:predicted ATPase